LVVLYTFSRCISGIEKSTPVVEFTVGTVVTNWVAGVTTAIFTWLIVTAILPFKSIGPLPLG
jgi:hypothetical protein